MGGWIDLHVDVIKGGMNKYKMTNPIFRPGHLNPQYSNFLVFEGISVDDQGKQHYLDASLAYKNACLNCIEYLKQCGYSGEWRGEWRNPSCSARRHRKRSEC